MGQYTQTTGQNLDFGLEGIDSYEQIAGTTLDFELIEATQVTLTEDMAMDDRFERAATTFFRNYNAQLAFSDADIRQLERLIQESFALNDVRSSRPNKVLSEQTGFNDSYSRAASFERTQPETVGVNGTTFITTVIDLFETLAVNDSDVRKLNEVLAESFSSNDEYSRTATFFRDYSEDMVLDDAIQAIIIRSAELAETLGINDTTELLTVVKLLEDLALDDFYSRQADFFRNYSDTLALNDFESFQLQRLLNETLALSTFAPITTVARLDEVMTVDDTVSKTPGKVLSETVSLDDSIRERNVFAVRTERLGINDADVRELQRTLAEALAVNAQANTEADLFRNYSEDFTVDDADTKLFMKLLETETLGVDEEKVFKIKKQLSDTLNFRDVFISDADYFRQFNEDMTVTEVKDFTEVLFRTYEADMTLADQETTTMKKALTEALDFEAEMDYFFSEGPGTPPYYMRNTFVQQNTVQNNYATKSIQNLFEALHSIDNSFGNQEQT